jgi:hypothetical protein
MGRIRSTVMPMKTTTLSERSRKMTSFATTARTAVARAHRISRELGYAQRRVFEIRTGIPTAPPRPLPRRK